MLSSRNVLIALLILIVVGMAYVLLWPEPIDPVAWSPPEAPALRGVYELNDRLAAVQRIASGVDLGPEDVAFDRRDRIYAGMEYGRIVRFSPDGGRYEGFAETGGRPLGLQFDPRGHLVVADAERGLLSVTPDGEVTVLATGARGGPFALTDGVDVAKDGAIYFTDASYKFSLSDVTLDMLEHGMNGRMMVYHRATGQARVLLDRLSFASGVAVNPDQSFVLVCETWKYRILRYWLTGPRAGKWDVFIENLPGFPGGVSSNGKDTFWVALAAGRNPRLDGLLPHPFLRKTLAHLMWLGVRLEPEPCGFVLGLDKNANVVHNLQDPQGTHYARVTSVEEHRGMLYLCSTHLDSIGRLRVPERP